MEFVLAERFFQDPLEEYFGRRKDHPDIKTFGCKNNTNFSASSALPKTLQKNKNTRGRNDKTEKLG